MLASIFIAVLLTSVTKCYFFVQQSLNWQEAQNHCLAEYGSSLGTITTEAEYQQALRDIKAFDGSRFDTWVGLNDINTEGVWQWVDGTDCSYTSTGLCTDDVHWNPNEPNDSGTEDCGVINPDGYGSKYNDLNCRGDLYFLCNPPNPTCADILLTDLTILSSTSGWSQSPYVNTWLGQSSIPMGDDNMYDNFLVIHPPNRGSQSVEYELNAQYEMFTAVIGTEHSGVSGGTCVLQNDWAFSYNFYVDNVLTYRSPTFNKWDQFVKVEIDVLHANVFKIETNSEGSNYCDHATLGNPTLICPSACAASQYSCQCDGTDMPVCIDSTSNVFNAGINEKRTNDGSFQIGADEQGKNTKIEYWAIGALLVWTVISAVIIILQQFRINKFRKSGYEIAAQDDDSQNIETCKHSEK